jgi:hypothetical protein
MPVSLALLSNDLKKDVITKFRVEERGQCVSVKFVEKLTNNCNIYKWIQKNIEKDIITKFRVEERDNAFFVKLVENARRFMEYFL